MGKNKDEICLTAGLRQDLGHVCRGVCECVCYVCFSGFKILQCADCVCVISGRFCMGSACVCMLHRRDCMLTPMVSAECV